MYTNKNTMDEILRLFPDFSEKWNDYLKEWEGEERPEGMDISEFSRYIADKLKNREDYDYKKLFSLIEELIINGDEEIKIAATTQFLENLVNKSSHGHFPLKSFAKYLGKESKEFCKGWDEFCGIDSGDVWK